MKNIAKYGFLVVAIATILEFYFIAGMFTGPTMMFLSAVFGIWNIIVALKDKDYYQAALYAVTTVALNIGYLSLL